MGIVDEDIVRVREATDAIAIVSQYTQLKRVGRGFQGLCPFHSEKSGSFSLNAEEGLYYCFGCGAKGDMITFVCEKEQLGFAEAVEWLAAKSSITLRYTDAHESEDRKRRSELQNMVGQAVDWYHQRLMKHKDAGAARGYLRKRGYGIDIVEKYKIGWAPDAWDQLAKALRLSNEDFVASGLGFINRRNRQQDAFRNRIMFPIFDPQGAAVGFGGRILPPNEKGLAKYKNSSDSLFYKKSRLLYGLHWAKSEIVQHDEVFVCEGYTDVIGLAQAGVGRAVATCGTSLTEDHVKILRRFARRVVLAFDADLAGQNAAMRFYEWEKAYEVEVAVADFPQGKDPGELALSDPESLLAGAKNAIPFLGFRIERLLTTSDVSTVEARARAAEKSFSMIKEHPDELVRDQYAMQVASRLRLQPELVRDQLRRKGATRSSATPKANKRKKNLLRDSPELEALKLLVKSPETSLPYLLPELFDDPAYIDVYDLLVRSASLHEAIESASEHSSEILHKLSVEETEADLIDVSALLWASYLERLMTDSRESITDEITPETVAHHTWLRMRLEALREPETQVQAVEALANWLQQDLEDDES